MQVVDLAFVGIQIRQRNEPKNPAGDGADAVGRNDGTREHGTPAARPLVTGERIVDVDTASGEVSGAESGAGESAAVHLAEVIPAALVVAEEEEFVADDAAAEGAAELVIDGGGLGDGERVAGLDVFVPGGTQRGCRGTRLSRF